MESKWEEVFRTAPKSFSRKTRLLCPVCWERREDRVYQALFWSFLALLPPGLLLAIAFPNLSVGALLLNISAAQVLMVLSTVLHESGHALGAALVGWRVLLIEVGEGRILYEFGLFGFRWQFRGVPLGGFTHIAWRDTSGFRLKRSLTTSCGPFMDVVLASGAILCWSFDDVFHGTPLHQFSPMMMLLLVNAAMLAWSLWPREVQTQYGKLPNDALRLWRTWSCPKAEFEGGQWYYYYLQGKEFRHDHRYQEARCVVEEALQQYPKNFYLEMLAAGILFDLKDYREARLAYIRLLARYGEAEDPRYTLLNNIACADLALRDAELFAEADVCSRMALEKAPWVAYFQETRGSLLVELGDLDAGTKLLLQALAGHHEKKDRASSACYLGIAERLRGNPLESKRFFDLARRLDPECSLLERENA